MNPEDRQSDLEHREVVCYLPHFVARPDKSDEKEKRPQTLQDSLSKRVGPLKSKHSYPQLRSRQV